MINQEKKSHIEYVFGVEDNLRGDQSSNPDDQIVFCEVDKDSRELKPVILLEHTSVFALVVELLAQCSLLYHMIIS